MHKVETRKTTNDFDKAITDIAIVGMAGRFPGAGNVEAFWRNLADGVESISHVSPEEALAAGISPDVLNRSDYVNVEFALDHIDMFDAAFFGIPPKEAEFLDPQHRLFMECAWEAIEDAGYTPEAFKGLIGVYAGVGPSGYLFDNLYPQLEPAKAHEVRGINDKDHLATRVSYKLNLQGPSITVQTACSTSLVAICLACQSLLGYQCDMVLAGGTSIKIPHKTGFVSSVEGALSPDGHCRAFDAKARGTTVGAGVGIVVLKRRMDAQSDGDHIYAVIKGSAINNDGSAKVGYLAPSVKGQAKVIAMAHAVAGVKTETIGYVEAHGTGTSMGDPIEIAALTQAFRAGTQKKRFCAIGSVKTNIGHTDTAAGVASVIKTALALKHKLIPPSLNFEQPNAEIDFENSPFYVNTQLSEWKADGAPRRAGVSAFGLGGTNAHVILEESPVSPGPEPSRPWELLAISARTDVALEAATANLVEHLKRHPDLNLADVAYTLHMGRRAFDHRRVLVCRELGEAVTALETLGRGQVFTGFVASGKRKVVFMFPGIGSLYVGMGSELYQTEPVFREHVDRCSDILQACLGLDLRRVLYPPSDLEQQAWAQLEQGPVGLSALFVTSYALARLWMSWGVHPQAMIGHSLGEYVAACLAGVLSLEDALHLSVLRGQLFDQLPEGAMLTVLLSEEKVRPFLSETLSLAAVNAPDRCVVSGPTEAITALEDMLAECGVEHHRMPASRAAHSSMAEPILGAFAEAVGRVSLRPPDIPYVSNVTGSWVTATEATSPDHWVKHLRQTVRFWDGIQEILKDPACVLVEVGPGRTLSALVKLHVGGVAQQAVFSSMRLPREPQPDVKVLLDALSRLWLAGVPVDWAAFYAQEHRRRISLPTYPFERQRYWVEPRLPGQAARALERSIDIADWFYFPSWERSPLSNLYRPGSLASQRRRWLLFADGLGLGSKIAQKLVQESQHIIIVNAGERFERVNTHTFIINSHERGDYSRLLDELEMLGEFPEKIIYLWSVTPDEPTSPATASLEAMQHVGFHGLLSLARSISVRGIANPLEIWVVSDSLHEVSGEESLHLENAAVLALCIAMPREYPGINCHNIDIAVSKLGDDQEEKLVEQIVTEISAEVSDAIVAYRGHHRWLPILHPVRPADQSEHNPRLRRNGVYLIIGELEGLGYQLARYLAETVQPKLMFLNQLGLPAREVGSALPLRFDEEWERIDQLEAFIEGKEEYEEFPQGLEEIATELSCIYIRDYLEASGVNTTGGKTYHKKELKDKLRILPKFAKFYDYLIWMLVQGGTVELTGDIIKFLNDRTEVKHPSVLKRELEEGYPGFKHEFDYLEYCVGHYDRALSGEIDAISVLYPDGVFDAVRPIMRNRAKFSNTRASLALAGEIVRDLANRNSGRLRVIEVGGGNGTLTRVVVRGLKDQNVEYHFTDIGKSFTVRAQQEALREGFDFMEFGVLDISESPVDQGYEKYSFDVILAFDVIHATKDLMGTIQHLKKLLAPNGVMLVVESVWIPCWSPLIFGLAEGLWYFAEDEARKHLLLPGFSPDQWEEVFRKNGFENVCAYPRDKDKRARADRIVLVAQQPLEICADDYSAWVAEGEKKQAQRADDRARKVRALEDLGAKVVVVKADIASDEGKIRAVVDDACERFGGMNGVIHLVEPARSENDRALISSSVGDHLYHLPNMHKSIELLERALQDKYLDFRLFVCSPDFSKTSFSLGLAASLFLDAYAGWRSRVGTGRWMSVKWDVGHGEDGEVQPATTDEIDVASEQEKEAFVRLLSIDALAQAVVSPRRLREWTDQWYGLNHDRVYSDAAGSPALHLRSGLQNAYIAPRDETEQVVAKIWTQVFGISQIGIHDSFFELGGESLMATRIISRLRETFEVELSVRNFLENPTIAQVAKAIGEARSRQKPAIRPVSREAYRAKRSSEGKINLLKLEPTPSRVQPTPSLNEEGSD